MKRGTPDHRKMKALGRTLEIPLPYANGLMERLWHYAAQYVIDGGIGRLTDAEISEAAGWPERKGPAQFVFALLKSGWLDRSETCRLFIHDWPEHCDDTTHRLLARRRSFFANGKPPQLTRLTKKDRVSAEEFYSKSARLAVEELRLSRAHDVRTECALDAHDVRTECAPECALPKAISLKPKASASTDAHGGAHEEPPPELSVLDDHPQTARAVRKVFEDADDAFVRVLVTKCVQEVISAGRPAELVTDEVIAYAVGRCTKTKQESAGLYLTTVPAWIRNKATTEAEYA